MVDAIATNMGVLTFPMKDLVVSTPFMYNILPPHAFNAVLHGKLLKDLAT